MVESFNYSHLKEEMSGSQRQAVITLLEKKGKDRLKVQNWRPISLLNNDYKIASKTIAYRIKSVLKKLIHSDQSGFVEGRNISLSLRTILDIMDITDRNKISGILMLVNFEKAFDTVNIDFLIKTLHKYNFGNSLIKWIRTFYNNISSCIINNQVTSKYFKVGRGVRQGDPLSSFLFILVAEILSIKI